MPAWLINVYVSKSCALNGCCVVLRKAVSVLLRKGKKNSADGFSVSRIDAEGSDIDALFFRESRANKALPVVAGAGWVVWYPFALASIILNGESAWE